MDHQALSICIPTYNRKERLISQLESLCGQEGVESVPVIVSDNASDYSIEREVLPLFKGRLNLSLRRFGANTSMIVNLSSGYIYAETEWVWFLGDDDKTVPGALKKITEDLSSASDELVLVKYSLGNPGFLPHKDEVVGSVTEFIDHYRNLVEKSPDGVCAIAGSCGFISTYVARCAKLRSYAYYAFLYGYNHLAFFAPALFPMEKGWKVMFSSARVVDYVAPQDGSHWRVSNYLLGLCSWRDMPLKVSERNKKWFVRFMSTPVPLKMLKKDLFHSENASAYKMYVLGKVMRECYQLNPISRLCHAVSFWWRIAKHKRVKWCAK